MTVETLRFSPQAKQREFLSTSADIAIFGGSAGGGKSWSLLYEPLRHVKKVKGFTATIFRRTYPQIMNPGAAWDLAATMYPPSGAKVRIGDREYEWPSGAKVSFRHLEHEDSVHDYQGTEICMIGFDELSHFSERQFWYMLSRNRSTCGIKPYVRASCNPDPGWLKSFLAPWVDDRFEGTRAASGELRWFIRVSGEIRWVSPETEGAKSLTFVRSSVYDNQVLLKADPGYLNNLKALLPVERARLLDGDWNARVEGLVYPEAFDPAFDVIVERDPPRGLIPNEGGLDFGINAPFVALSGYVHDEVLWVTGERYVRNLTIPEHSARLPRGVSWWCDPAGLQEASQLRQAGHSVVSCVHISLRGASGETKSPKRSGIDMVRHRMRTGRLKILRSRCPNLVRELGQYVYDAERPELEEPVKKHDHSLDALRYWVVGRDRHNYTTSIYTETESAEQRAQRERDLQAEFVAQQLAAYDRGKELDRLAQQDPFNERWWNA